MATLLLSAAGSALGAGFGGTVLGLSGAVIGRAIGATLGRAIDQRLLGGGAEPVEVGRLDRLRLLGANDGAAVPRLWGRARMGGQVIWASDFAEHVSTRRGGKGGGGGTVNSYSYTVSLAIGLCEGEILRLGRIWADGVEIAPATLALRLYHGSVDQLPDPKICAIEGEDQVPGFRGLAYVVIEDLDLSPYGNRVPMFSFEVMRDAQGAAVPPGLSKLITAVAMIPGTGEYALATSAVHQDLDLGEGVAINSNTASGESDFATSLTQLAQELPRCKSVSLVVAWFGSDLRCGECLVRPRVEQAQIEAAVMPWRVAGLERATAGEVPRKAGALVYGGTPADAAVIEAIRAIRAKGMEVMFYPFILMEQMAGNTLPDPWRDAASQPDLPWRGRITSALAPGRVGTPDRTAAAAAQVAAFFGTASPDEFSLTGEEVSYTGSDLWRYRRFILHYAFLCKAAGGVDAFCIGSELVGLTLLRDAADGFPAVAALRQLLADVRVILGPEVKLSYAADWTEYAGYQADGNLYFPLDPLWADPEVDFIGIDNYLPLADWRDGDSHADAAWGSVHDLDYLAANIAGGEYHDWYYDNPEAAQAQRRLPIEDGAYGEPWVYRLKDLRSWWGHAHHPRIAGVRAATATVWQPGSKPLRFTEYGCAALDKAANQPNKFLDLHSSESQLPRGSNGRRDDAMQLQYLRAMAEYWANPEHNPPATAYAGRMLDTSRMHVWTWDARPFPQFPARHDLWGDAANYGRGHWLNGRALNQPLASVIAEICAAAGVVDVDTSAVTEVLRGYHVDQLLSARALLQPLLLAYGVEAFERDGRLHFRSRSRSTGHVICAAALAVEEDLDGRVNHLRGAAGEAAGSLRLSHIDAEGDYGFRMAETRAADATANIVAASEVALALTVAEGKAITARWLAETRIARDSLRLALPPSRHGVGAADVLHLPDGGAYRVDRVELTQTRRIEASRIETSVYHPGSDSEQTPLLQPHVAPVPCYPVLLDLPLLTGAEIPHQPYIAVAARPWPGRVALWTGSSESGFTLNRLITAPSSIGRTETPLAQARPGIWDKGPALRLRLNGPPLQSVSRNAVLNGRNLLAIGDPLHGQWEVLQFAKAELVAPLTWEISDRLRGQAGTDGVMPALWPVGSVVVLLDAAPQQIDLPPDARGLSRLYRVGVAARGQDDPAVVERAAAFEAIGLRPYSVAHLRRSGGLGAAIGLRWQRRSRIGGDDWQQFEVPLSEDRELYLLRVLDAGAILGEYISEAPRFTYEIAAQLADGAGAGSQIAVAQLSERYGPGPFRHITLTP